MNGCVFKRKLASGRVDWVVQIDLGRDASGKRIREFKSGYERKGDAEDALRKRLNAKDAGEIVKPDPTSFTGFMKEWLREYAERQCQPKTVERYREMIAYVDPHIGTAKIQDLSALTLERLFQSSEGRWWP